MTALTNLDVYQATHAWALQQGLRVWSADETTSTNSIAKDDSEPATAPRATREVFEGPTLYIAGRQTQGRGRGDHVWTTPPGGALLSTWSYSISRVPQPIFSALVGLALFRAARAVWPAWAWNLKAPNDLFLGDKKTAGLLIETIDAGAFKRTVIGLGLNVSTKPAGVDTATCLRDHGEVSAEDWDLFLASWRRELERAIREGRETTLQTESAADLTAALQLHPLLKEPLLRVDELGQLHFASRVVHWHEL